MISRQQLVSISAALLLICCVHPAVSLSTVRLSHRRTSSRLTTPSSSSHISKSYQSRIYSRSKSTSLLKAVEGDFDPNAIENSKKAIESGSTRAKLNALYKFTRPHTIRGTILASIAGTTRALIDTPGAIANANWNILLPRAVIGMIALLLGNAFIVGINQIFDKDIDVLNKPFLPVASGEMSNKVAWGAVGFSGIVGPAIV